MSPFEQISFPIQTLDFDRAKLALTESIGCVTDEWNLDSIPRYYLNIDGIYVKPDLFSRGFNKVYFDTPIEGKYVYATVSGHYTGLPCRNRKFQVSDVPLSKEERLPRYAPVMFGGEKTLGDLYRRAWRYAFYSEAYAYMLLPEEGALRQLVKPLIARRTAEIGGHSLDRIADYGRLILFLLSKVDLTEEEKKRIAPMLGFIPDADSLADIANREAKIQTIVKTAKEAPRGFIG